MGHGGGANCALKCGNRKKGMSKGGELFSSKAYLYNYPWQV